VIRSFDELDRLGARAYDLNGRPCDHQQVLGPTNVGRSDGPLIGLITFDPELAVGAILRWGCEWGWYGLWNQLRTTGEDRCFLDLREGDEVQYECVICRIVLPAGSRGPVVRAIDETISAPQLNTDPETGRPFFTFRLEKPAHRLYEFAVRVSGIDSAQAPAVGRRHLPVAV
jgi:hypothetical protein